MVDLNSRKEPMLVDLLSNTGIMVVLLLLNVRITDSPLSTDMVLVVLLLINMDRLLTTDMAVELLLSNNSMDNKARMGEDMVNSNTLVLVVLVVQDVLSRIK
jgi:hypothetical protein